MVLYQDQYPLFGDPEVLPVKVIWDYTYYWGVLAQFFFHQRLTDLSSLAALRSELAECQQINVLVQAFLRRWSLVSQKRNPAVMLDQAGIPWFAELNRSLNDDLDTEAFLVRIRESHARLKQLAGEIILRAQTDHPDLQAGELTALLSATADAGSLSNSSRMLPETVF
jgi:hypothetical protein